ncbi:DNA topoisomerase IV subunit B (EC [Bathymodiolus brooksi thiotrophic gill symbiont]|jgi:topoisomerase-4 subunit B|nr:DNA topoisomerase IV subunit B (EC [Bathymodiolus brooksi thiotrophic gill symbiont]CAC9590374.1 DNA topoisomerase IV subunit B (EC 5.99.1.3) [uncultured Gammaproteobacteria bacterium]CAB9543283.1 DNA topoisomerase IV subunit B (EC [Bathymodiolus brooksi thiotrophic gill symbiont]CAC9958688.1 DNA topoisomerase IV subunit B (EC 5.99.1.3) [uncultured Gammaproteobacteria bacterium]CAC9961571.1 DNA topoisomerase IV subunit B (EC 5.99.1.3) [uncultured Gammaproteobacteria bacterium]
MSNYDSSSIEVLSGLDPVRKRPGMYTETERPNHLAQEVIDNSVDEAVAGYATKINVVLCKDNSISVEDNGRGMPVDIHPKEGVSGVEVILTKLHAGGKFSNDSYQFSGGLHGVGISVVNALSTLVEVWIKRDSKTHYISFSNGLKKSELEVIGAVGKRNTGTKVKFTPDAQFFDTVKFSITKLRHNLRSKAVLCPGLDVTFHNEIDGTEDHWNYKDGLKDYLSVSLDGLDCLPEVPFVVTYESNEQQMHCSLAWTEYNTNVISESYVNLIPTSQGGTHVNGLRSGLTDALKEFCEFRNLLPKNLKLTPDDVWQKIAYVLSIKILDPQFSGQTKERLSSRECASFVANVVKDIFSLWLNQHTAIAEKIAELAIMNAQSRMKTGKKIIRKKIVSGPALPGKLSDCTSNDLDQTEVFLVEGDSAGGSAKQARDKEYQAILPLRGKILNTWEVDSDQVLASNEIHDISVAIGLEPNCKDLSGLRYGKICILADADSDGAHIATLICTLFVKHFPKLVKEGHIYVAMPPLYRIDAGKQVHYALDNAERDAMIKKIEKENKRVKIQVQRFKGLGEMNPSQLRETTMLPDTRRLIQLTLDNPLQVDQMMDMLLSKKRAPDRKKWLEEKGNLANV